MREKLKVSSEENHKLSDHEAGFIQQYFQQNLRFKHIFTKKGLLTILFRFQSLQGQGHQLAQQNSTAYHTASQLELENS